MRSRIALFLVVVLIVMTFYGCSSDTGAESFFSTGSGKNSGTTDQNYNKGTTGLTISFLANNPPNELYNGQSFPCVLEIYNTGVTDTNPYITLTGYDRNIVKIDWSDRQPGKIYGKSQLNPTGGYGVIDDNLAVSLPSGVDTFTTPITAIACYEYVTEGVTSLCVDPDPTNNRDDVCTAAKLTQLSGGQGAPVAITKIETKPSIGVNYFIITVSNMDKTGTVIKPSRVSSCTDQLTYQEVDVVDIASASVGAQAISCEPATIKLVNGVGTTTCEATGLAGSAYTTSLQLNLRYGYKTSITKSLTIRRM